MSPYIMTMMMMMIIIIIQYLCSVLESYKGYRGATNPLLRSSDMAGDSKGITQVYLPLTCES